MQKDKLRKTQKRLWLFEEYKMCGANKMTLDEQVAMLEKRLQELQANHDKEIEKIKNAKQG